MFTRSLGIHLLYHPTVLLGGDLNELDVLLISSTYLYGQPLPRFRISNKPTSKSSQKINEPDVTFSRNCGWRVRTDCELKEVSHTDLG